MKPTFSLKKCIQDRVQREDDARWGKSKTKPQNLTVNPVASLPRSVGLAILFKNFVYSFRP